MAKRKLRLIYRLRWSKNLGATKSAHGWWVDCTRGLPMFKNRPKMTWFATKAAAEKHARQWCRNVWKIRGFPVQLLIHNKDGKIGHGDRAEASYGCDSRARG